MTYLDFFSELTRIPRPSHHEEKVADYLCRFAEEHNLKYRRNEQNCVVIEKPASPGYEKADPVVILNHMDMVCVAKEGYLRDGRPFDPLTDEIRTYIETDADGHRWMKAEGTSLGADNGMGLSMALAILADDSLEHPALEVLTTTNEEDGMSGAAALSTDFIRGRKVINLDSEAYDEITVGAAGAILQVAHGTPQWAPLPSGYVFRKLVLDGGLGGHSGVDIGKHRCNCNSLLFNEMISIPGALICTLNGGTANASIAPWAEAVVAFKEEDTDKVISFYKHYAFGIQVTFKEHDPNVRLHIEETEPVECYMTNGTQVLKAIQAVYCGAKSMRKDMPGTVMTSNNVGVVRTTADDISVSCHTRSFSNEEQRKLADDIKKELVDNFADKGVEELMETGAWMEREDSPLLALTCHTFQDVLGFQPKKVAMHFVLEAAYYVEKYPGIEMASIGPRIIEPHSTSERIDLNTADDIWKVTLELLKRLK